MGVLTTNEGGTLNLALADGGSVLAMVGTGTGTGSVTSVTATAPIVITGSPGVTPNVTITPATEAAAGSMSAADKTKLDGLGPGTLTPGNVQPAALQGNLFIDPQNSTGNASPAGPGTALAPFDRWSSLVNAWGTNAPRVNTSTTITFLSASPADGSDPVDWRPTSLLSTTLCQIKGTRTQVAAGVLAGVIANSLVGAGSMLNVTLAAGLAVGMRVINTTKASMAILHDNTGGNTWNVSQPLLLTPPPRGPASPGKDNTWANGDAYQVVTQTKVDIVNLAPIVPDWNVGASNSLAVYSLDVIDDSVNPAGLLLAQTPWINWYECGLARAVIEAAPGSPLVPTSYFNCDFAGDCGLANATIYAGIIRSSGFINGGTGFSIRNNTVIDSTIVLEGGGVVTICMLNGAGVQLTNRRTTTRLAVDSGGGGGPTIYGTGQVVTQGSGSVNYPAGAGAAVAAFQNTGGLRLLQTITTALNGSATAIPTLSAALTPANLDNAGVFNGWASAPGAGSFRNVGV